MLSERGCGEFIAVTELKADENCQRSNQHHDSLSLSFRGRETHTQTSKTFCLVSHSYYPICSNSPRQISVMFETEIALYKSQESPIFAVHLSENILVPLQSKMT